MGAGDRELHLFDTFEGMPPPTENDRRIEGGSAAAEMLASEAADRDRLGDRRPGRRQGRDRADWLSGRAGPLPPRAAQDTIPAQAPDQIALMRLDTDWYESTRHELEHLYDESTPAAS